MSYFNISGQSGVAFRNGKNFKEEELNIFYKGSFWKMPLRIAPGFYDQQNVAARFGGEKLCLSMKFNFVATDTIQLSKYDKKTCREKETITLFKSDEQSPTAPAKVISKHLASDLEIYYKCIRSRDGVCGEENIKASFAKISRWNSEICELSDHKPLGFLVTEQHVLLKSSKIPVKTNMNQNSVSSNKSSGRIRLSSSQNAVSN